MKKGYIASMFLFFGLTLMAQPKEVTLVVTGEGVTKEEATNNALRIAIEQAFGVFVSSNSEILNDELVRDEIATVSSGNIKNYKEISYTDLSEWRKSITLETTVSVGKLIDYSKSHGSKAEFSGAVFGANQRLREQRKNNESIVVGNQVQQLNVLRKTLFNSSIKVKTPRVESVTLYDMGVLKGYLSNYGVDPCSGFFLYVIDSKPHGRPCRFVQPDEMLSGLERYVLPLTITLDASDSGEEILKNFNNVIQSLALSEQERGEYDAESIVYYPLFWIDNKTYYFRDEQSVSRLNEFIEVIYQGMFNDWQIIISYYDNHNDTYTQWIAPSLFNEGSDVDLALSRSGRSESPDQIELFEIERPIRYNPSYNPNYPRRGKAIPRIVSAPLDNVLKGRFSKNIFEYEIDLLISQEKLEKLTSVELMQKQ